MGRKFVMGDIHGANRALVQCLERSHFDPASDSLICLGDVADGWPETKQCIDTLLGIPQLVFLLGNHDFWMLDWMENGTVDDIWFEQGGEATISSFGQHMPESHVNLLQQAKHYWIEGRRLFVHAGVDPQLSIDRQTVHTLLWSRDLAHAAQELIGAETSQNLTPYNEVYIGHTPIQFPTPQRGGEVWLMDTGAGWSGVLSMMDIESKQVFTSDPVPLLYPGIKGRVKRK